ncbi:carotenoid biosynthesis protein [Leptolyngbya sp. CCNP1308]|uniref:gamma-carotene 1'-hydroxylase CruF n=1 Tax=Leptolyngbya sp. CCNP1308 TaxID=3110255 RepID=UPI002B20DCCA|nr:carotenoid biosynthesis protein [Leptolyngbya sp. CCNP1308]MEA5451031.1 carotenoid biosynthesis protein [Leptolyngbya sp. CCNP1308]
MRNFLAIERFCLYGHVVAMVFGLAGLLWVVPHPGILEYLPAGPTLFRWSMAGGGVGYILLGTLAMALYAYRTLGLGSLITFAIASVGISVTSELLGTSTGFPFGNYTYLNGLGYKVAGLVPFTIPLSWFYLGLASFLLARSGLAAGGGAGRYNWARSLAAVVLGSVLLTSWDFVLDPAMSQTALPFWYWHEPGAFFGMPYQNFAGWLGTGVVFMGVALGLWKTFKFSPELDQGQLTLPLVVYLANFGFALVMSLAAGFYVPIALGILTGALPAVLCWRATAQEDLSGELAEPTQVIETPVAATKGS